MEVGKEYEKRIVLLKEQHEKIEDSDEKIQLTHKINALIDETKAALA